MLLSWGALNDPSSPPNANSHDAVETNEAREARVRASYSSALNKHAKEDLVGARDGYTIVADELRPDEEPDWVRSVLYAALRNLADVQCALGETVKSLERYGQALDVDGGDFMVWRSAARVALSCGRLHVARRAIEYALVLRPGHWLCVEDHRAVLYAIGDADEDVAENAGDGAQDDVVSEKAARALASRVDWIGRERKEVENDMRNTTGVCEHRCDYIEAGEPTWFCLVNVLRSELKRRLADSNSEIGRPIYVKASRVPAQLDVATLTATHVAREEKVSHGNEPKHASSEIIDIDGIYGNSVEIVDEETKKEGKESTPAEEQPADQKRRCDTLKKPVEIRKSKRQADLDIERERKRERKLAMSATRTSVVDWGLTGRMMSLLKDAESDEIIHPSMTTSGAVTSAGSSKDTDGVLQARGEWSARCPQSVEETEVAAFIESFAVGENGGPLDLLLRILRLLAAKQRNQYIEQIALAWLNVFRHLPSSTVFSPAECLGMAESLLASGDEAARKVPRLARFREARRLLLHYAISAGCGFDKAVLDGELSRSSGEEHPYFLVRVHWLLAQLSQRSSDVQGARDHILRCREIFHEMQGSESFVQEGECLPVSAGPLFCGMTLKAALCRVERESCAFRKVGELADARAALVLGKKKKDPSLGVKVIRLLWPSLEARIRALDFEKPCSFTGDLLPVLGSAARETFDSHVSILGEACELASDDVGDLVCKAVTLRAAIIDLYFLEEERRRGKPHEVEGRGGQRSRVQGEEQPDLPSPSSKRSEIVSYLRQFVALVKKVSAIVISTSATEASSTGWSAKQALSVAGKSLVAVSHVLQARIPRVPSSCTNLELTASQKNQRLAFSRVMLGFGRCVDGISHPTGDTLAERCSAAIRTLRALSFALRALVPRACLREEGTSGALIKMYLSVLTLRLHQLAEEERRPVERVSEIGSAGVVCTADASEDRMLEATSKGGFRELLDDEALRSRKAAEVSNSDVKGSDDADDDSDGKSDREERLEPAADDTTDWNDVSAVRSELSQCFRTLYNFADLEGVVGGAGGAETDEQWMVDGVALSKRLGLAFVTGENAGQIAMDTENCRAVYDFHRVYLLEVLACQWRDGRKSRRAREIVTQLAAAVPADAPAGVPSLELSVLDAALSSSLELVGRTAISTLREEWAKAKASAAKCKPKSLTALRATQFSRMYYELHMLHVMSTLSMHEAEFKKQKSVERRKSPKDAVERLINQASQDCVAALRARPWSAATWALVGRVFLEIADVALDEREYVSSTFGIVRSDDLSSGDLGDPVVSMLGRAEGCFRLADALTKEQPNVSTEEDEDHALSDRLDDDAFGAREDDAKDSMTRPLGTDCDFFGSIGIADCDGSHTDDSKRAVVQFGQAAVHVMRLREERYRSRCWKTASLSPRVLDRKSEFFLREYDELVEVALKCIEKGMRFVSGTQSRIPYVDAGREAHGPTHSDRASGSPGTEQSTLSSMMWYYQLLRAKLYRKSAKSDPLQYLDMFASAAKENARQRRLSNEPADIEPFYKLHATRLKVLLEQDLDQNPRILTALELHAYKPDLVGPAAVARGALTWDTMSGDKEDGVGDDLRVWSKTVRRKLIGQDVCAAMQFCRQQKNIHPHSEFFFKAAYIRGLALWRVGGDRAGALLEMNNLFRGEAAARAAEPSGDGIHRGYFFTVWNYRHTDTGYELSIETERKYLRWRNKLLGLYGALLDESQDARVLAGVISRLKRRHPDDLPVNGAVLDDWVGSYADVCIAKVQKTLQAESREGPPTVALSEAALHRTWDMYTETIRLSQGVRRTRQYMEREPDAAGVLKVVVDSHRPWCLVAAACALHMEWKRLQAAKEGRLMQSAEVATLPINGEDINDIAPEVFATMADSIEACAERWPVENKLVKPMRRRIEEYRRGGPLHGKSSQASKMLNARDNGQGHIGGQTDVAKLLGAVVSPLKPSVSDRERGMSPG